MKITKTFKKKKKKIYKNMAAYTQPENPGNPQVM